MLKTTKRTRHFVLTAIACVLCVACASAPTNPDGSQIERSPADPWEPLNRAMYESNGFLDRVTFKPLAKGYGKVVPKFIRRGIRNFSRNLRAPLNIINCLLQGKAEGFRQTGRFLINSTVGLGGFIDVATHTGIDVQQEDFGQTLAVWGVPDGPYVFIPVLGPLTLRDAVMLPLNFLADPLVYYEDSIRLGRFCVRAKACLRSTPESRSTLPALMKQIRQVLPCCSSGLPGLTTRFARFASLRCRIKLMRSPRQPKSIIC